MTVLAANLDQSRAIVPRGHENEFWLYSDGTVSAKTWFGRIIRWFQNFFCNTTLVDIMSVFERTVLEYVRLRNSYRYHIGSVALEDLRGQAQRVTFAAGFLHSRAHRLEQSLGAQWQAQHLIGQIDPRQNPLTPLLIRLQTLSPEEAEDPRIGQLRHEDSQLIPLTPEILRKQGPSFNISELPARNDDLYSLSAIFSGLHGRLFPIDTGFFSWILRAFSQASQQSQGQAQLRRLCHAITTRDSTVPAIRPAALPLFYEQLTRLLLNTLPLLRDEEIPLQTRYDALSELIEAVQHCGPRWIEEAERIYRLLTNQELSPFHRVLLWKERFIEDLIVEKLRDSRHTINALNWIRSHWGEVLGITAHSAELDQNQEPPPFTLQELLNSLSQSWPRMVQVVKDKMGNIIDPEISGYLAQILQTKGIPEAQEFMFPEYYPEGRINDKGVHRLLRAALA